MHPPVRRLAVQVFASAWRLAELGKSASLKFRRCLNCEDDVGSCYEVHIMNLIINYNRESLY